MKEITIEGISDVIEKPEQEKPPNWRRYFSFSTDHKVIGIQYLVTSFIFFLVGGILAMVMRGELMTPESDLVDRTIYNGCLLYTSPSPRDVEESRMPSSA